MSLKARVMSFVAVAISLSMIIIGYLILQSVKEHFIEQDTDELLVITNAISDRLINATNKNLDLQSELARSVSGHHGIIYQIWNSDNQLIYGNIDTNISRVEFSLDFHQKQTLNKLTNWSYQGSSYRGLITKVPTKTNPYYVVVGINMDFHIEFLASFRNQLILIMAISGLLTLLVTWLGIYHGHTPLRNFSHTIAAVRADRLNVRLDSYSVPDELKNLVDSFNQMISRLEDSFHQLSNFSSDIAHELRTPLTNLITQTQVALTQSRSLEEYEELLYSNLEEHERLAKMVNEMLWLAKNDHGLIKPELECIDLCAEINSTVEYFELLADEKKVQIISECHPTQLECDPSMIRRALSNLLSNAIRHSNIDSTIRITCAKSETNKIIFKIENRGEVISEKHIDKIFDRFYRVDQSRQRQGEGSGLGLAIAKSIIESHHGEISVNSHDGITYFTMVLPQTISA